MDHTLGELFDSLERWGLEDDTLVVLGADHGESLGEHGVKGHGRELYEPSLHVPLIAAFPGRVDRARVVPETVRNVDLLPTLLELLDLEVPPNLDGRSLTAALRGGSFQAAGDGYAETLMPKMRFDGPERYALYRGPWKLLREVAPDGATSERLFHLGDDPRELRDRADQDRDVRAKLAEALDTRISRGAADQGPAALDADSEAALRALGYIE
jgi:arylsulfatase A-like enzyme